LLWIERANPRSPSRIRSSSFGWGGGDRRRTRVWWRWGERKAAYIGPRRKRRAARLLLGSHTRRVGFFRGLFGFGWASRSGSPWPFICVDPPVSLSLPSKNFPFLFFCRRKKESLYPPRRCKSGKYYDKSSYFGNCYDDYLIFFVLFV
jgi:hypothetical protein